MGWFQFGRDEGFPSQYAAYKAPVTIDVTETICIIIFVIITLAYLTIVPAYRKKRSIYVGVKVAFSMVIGCLLIVENIGQEWEVGGVTTQTPYRAGEKHELEASIRVKIGLRSVNITLRGNGEDGTPLAKEKIDYNERFSWTWDQGRIGFGPYAGLLQRSFREAQRKGLPLPILWVAEYFTIDGEGIRFGRFYRTAGWYTHILLWAAFTCWILAVVFLQSVGRYTAYFTAAVGGLQILACIVWINIRNPNPLIIPFADGTIKMSLGQHFWMTLICGITCLALALVLVFMDLRYPNALSSFLGIDPLAQYDECVLRAGELDNILRKKTENSMEMASPDGTNSQRNTGMMVLKRRSTIRNAQKELFRQPIPVKIEDYEAVAVYENQSFVHESPDGKNEMGDKTPPQTEVTEVRDTKPPPIPRKKAVRLRK